MPHSAASLPSAAADRAPPAARPVVGLIPAAGRATRMAPLPCSKELFPVGVHGAPEALRGRPKVVSQYLLDKMVAGGATQAFFVIRPGKFDIAEYYGDGSRLGLSIAYLMMGEPWGPPFSVAQAVPFIGDATVLFGFPDILVHPDDAFVRVRARLESGGADLVLGLFRAARAVPMDVVEVDATGRVRRLVTKEANPARGDADLGYLVAAWGPSFTRFLGEETARLSAEARSGRHGPSPEWPMGAVIDAAIAAGLHVDSLVIDDARFLDIGTPAGLAAAAVFPGVRPEAAR